MVFWMVTKLVCTFLLTKFTCVVKIVFCKSSQYDFQCFYKYWNYFVMVNILSYDICIKFFTFFLKWRHFYKYLRNQYSYFSTFVKFTIFILLPIWLSNISTMYPIDTFYVSFYLFLRFFPILFIDLRFSRTYFNVTKCMNYVTYDKELDLIKYFRIRLVFTL